VWPIKGVLLFIAYLKAIILYRLFKGDYSFFGCLPFLSGMA
jgi:hypothetical protein